MGRLTDRRRLQVVVGVALVVQISCGPAIRTARLRPDDPVSEREADAARRLAARSCSGGWGLAFPGLGQVCHRKRAEGVVLASLAVTEAATAIAFATSDAVDGDGGAAGRDQPHPGFFMPLVGLQDLWVYGLADVAIERRLARRMVFTPQDELTDLVWAPFNGQVLRQTDVWLGIAGMVAAGVGMSVVVGSELGDGFGDDVNYLGRQVSPVPGYALGGATFAGFFAHVAIAEEAMFRGLLQSDFARRSGETSGWIYGSLVFGAVHGLNAFTLPKEDRASYLKIGVPFITVIGSYMGLSYRWHDYSLAPPVAIHFWYDFLISAIFFAMSPQDSPLSAGITVPF